MFTGLSAFPLTPLTNDTLDEGSYVGLLERLRDARVDSITALGSTGSYAYLTTEERRRAAHLAVRHAGDIPVFVGVGALRTSQVLANVEAAEQAGASGVLLSPMTYQPLTEDDVFELFHTVTSYSSLPVIVYDNPATTHFTFTTGLHSRIAQLPGIASIKIPGGPDAQRLKTRVEEVRSLVPNHVTIGISGDASAAAGLSVGCDAWYSVVGGTLPGIAQRITRAALNGQHSEAASESARLAPLWQLFADFGGSLRVVAAIAEKLGLTHANCLPLPIQGLSPDQRARVTAVIEELGLDSQL
ncbi:dihydrodipicolinate synthase family protein [Paenarthrobacter aurescens]|uniref:dihydrodipicolinate synthase family protein n=1 Tax=Paenarthrobacter aurescens TaxID=43663 RepID=UPI0021C1E43A|nr:dihydrodipicolinate synthase family protein [Paenarthrobacter aurescens]MCT9869817.1 dihydrodipicolinate synthase family protein [Paenarthrobacter aurescens]